MAEAFVREFVKFEVTETSQDKGFWLERPWIDDSQREALAKASILVVPQSRDDIEGPVFPEGSENFLARFRELLGPELTLGVAIRADEYRELALHSRAWRLPTLFVTSIGLPLVINIFAARIDELLPGHRVGDTAEVTLIIEGDHHKALKLHYKGDPKDLGDLLSRSVPRFIDELDR